MADIKHDLGSKIKDVTTFAEALKSLQGIAQSLFSTLGGLTDTFGSQVSRAAQTAGTSSSPQFFTAAGTSAREELVKHLAANSERAFQSHPKMLAVSTDPNIVLRGTGLEIAGGSHRTFSANDAARQKQFQDLHTQALQGQSDPEVNKYARELGIDIIERKATPGATPAASKGPRAGLGYGISDLARISSETQGLTGAAGQDRFSKLIQNLESKNDIASSALATQLRGVQEALTGNINAMHQASQAYTESVRQFGHNSDQAKAATEHLTDVMGSVDKDLSSLKDIERFGGPKGGGGEGGFFTPGRMDMMKKWGGGLLGVGTAGANLYMQAGLSQDQAIYGKQLEFMQSTGAIASRRFENQLASRDMTRPENILKYGGDLLMPGRTQFLGATGLRNAEAAAADMLRLRVDMAREQRNVGIVGAVGQGLGAIGGGVAGAFVGGPVGALMGAGAGLSAMNALTQTVVGSPYTAMSGGLESGPLGFLGGMRRENYPSLAKYATAAAMMQQQQGFYENIDQFREAELQRFGPERAALEDIQDMRRAQQEATILVGGARAPTVNNTLTGYGGGRANPETRDYRLGIDIAQDARNARQRAINASGVIPAMTFPVGDIDLHRDTSDLSKEIKDMYHSVSKSVISGDLSEFRHAKAGKHLEDLTNSIVKTESHGDYSIWNGSDSEAYGKYQMMKETRDTWASRFKITPEQFILRKSYEKPTNGQTVEQWNTDAKTYQDMFFVASMEENRLAVKKMKNDRLLGANRFTDEQLYRGLHARGIPALPEILKSGIDPYEGKQRNSSVFTYMTGDTQEVSGPPRSAMVQAPLRMSRAASLEMSPAEFMMHQAQVTNVLGSVGTRGNMVGLKASDATTEDMIRLGRSGLGTFEQHLGTVSALNKISGGTDNTPGLKSILTEAVASGFNASRVAQAFVSNTTSIMNSLSLTNAATTATALGAGTSLIGYGHPDERSLAMAAQGQATFGQFTGQKGGLAGSMKMLGFSMAGGSLATGSGYALGMSMQKMQETAAMLEGSGPMNIEAETLARLNGGRTAGRPAAAKMLRGGESTMNGLMNAAARIISGKSFSEINAMSPEDAAARAANIGASSFLNDPAAGIAALQASDPSRWNIPANQSVLGQQLAASKESYGDAAKQKIRSYRDQMLADFSANVQGVDPSKYKEYLASGGSPVRGTSGRYVTKEDLESKDARISATAAKDLQTISRLDLIRESDVAAAAGEASIQSVRIINAGEVATAISLATANPSIPKASTNSSHTPRAGGKE